MSNTEIAIYKSELPTNIEDLTKFVLVGRDKLTAVRAAIRAIDKVGLAKEVRQQKLLEAQDLADAVLDAEVRIGELTSSIPKATNANGAHNPNGINQHSSKSEVQNDTAVHLNQPFTKSPVARSKPATTPKAQPLNPPQTKADVIKAAGFTEKQVQRFEQL